jgi:FG-GAP repeat
MKKQILLLNLIMFISIYGRTQNVGIGTNTPNQSAVLDVNSSSKGILFPRVTIAQRNAIQNPAIGLMVFDVEKNVPYYFDGVKWTPLAAILPRSVQPIEFSSGSASLTYTTNPFAVAMSGNYAAAGLPYFDSAGSNSIGAVQLYKKTNGVWSKSQRIIAPDTTTNDLFGMSMDMQGDYLVVGAPYKAVLATTNSGKAYVYKLNSVTGLFELDGQLTHPLGLSTNANFGFSVAVTNRSSITNGVAVAIGTPQQSGGGVSRGTVSIFRRNAANSYIHVNTINGNQDNEYLGFSVDIDSNLVMMGAPNFDTTISTTNYSNIGRVQINRFNGSNFSTIDFNLKPSIDTFCYYGYRVALDTNCMAVSGFISNANINGGYPKTYKRLSAGSYVNYNNFSSIEDQFDADNTSVSLYMGYNLAITNSFLIVGIPHEFHLTGSNGNSPGRNDYALVYKRTPGDYFHNYYTQLKAPDNQTSTQFGYAVAASGNDYIISMPLGNTSDGSIGAVYFGTILE